MFSASLLRLSRSAIVMVVPVVIGLLLLLASILKGYQLATEPTAESNLLSSRWFLIVIVEFQIILAAWLLAGLYPRQARLVALACFTMFFGVALYHAGSGAMSCNCFGALDVNPKYTAALDLAAIGGLTFWRPNEPRRPMERAHILVFGSFISVVLLCGILGGIRMADFRAIQMTDERDFSGDGDVVLLRPEKWMGRRCPLFRHIDIGNELTSGSWVLILYRHDCAKCAEEIRGWEAFARKNLDDPKFPQVALIEVPPHGEPRTGPVSADSPCRLGALSAGKRWFVTTPRVLLLKEGIVAEPGDYGLEQAINHDRDLQTRTIALDRRRP